MRTRHGSATTEEMREHVAIERIGLRVVHIRQQHTLTQIVKDDHPWRAPKPTKRVLVELGLALAPRPPRGQVQGLAAIAKRQHKSCMPLNVPLTGLSSRSGRGGWPPKGWSFPQSGYHQSLNLTCQTEAFHRLDHLRHRNEVRVTRASLTLPRVLDATSPLLFH